MGPNCSRSSTSNSSLRSSALRWPTPRNDAGVLVFWLAVAALIGAERNPDGFWWSCDVLHPASAANQLQSLKRTERETALHRWHRLQRAKHATAAPSQPWRTSCGVNGQVPLLPLLQSPWLLVSSQYPCTLRPSHAAAAASSAVGCAGTLANIAAGAATVVKKKTNIRTRELHELLPRSGL